MRFRSCFLATFLLLTINLSRPVQGQSASGNPLSQTTHQSVEGGVWRLDAGFDSTLHIKNVLLTQSLEARPSLVMANGTVVALPAIMLEPAGVATVNIGDAVKRLPPQLAGSRSEYGMAAVEYDWAWAGAIMASVQSVDETAMLSFHSSLQADRASSVNPQTWQSQRIESAWWKPYASTEMFLFLGNAADTAKEIEIDLRSSTGSTLQHSTVRLLPHASVKLKPFGLFSAEPSTGSTGSMSVKYVGNNESLVVAGGLEDLTNGFSETLHFLEVHPERSRDKSIHPIVAASPGVLLGKQPIAMQFPQDTSFSPYLILHNTAQAQRDISVSATLTQGGSVSTVSLGTASLASGTTKQFDFSKLLSSSLRPDHGSIQLTESFTGNENDIQFEVGSVDNSGNYVFEAETHLEAWTASRTICYWSIAGDTNTMISLWNYTQASEDLVLTLYFRGGGQYQLPLHLAPGADLDLDVASLMKQRISDLHGQVLPSNVVEGSASLSDAKGERERMEVASSTSTFNVRNGTCSNQCGTCNGETSVSLTPNPIYLTIGYPQQAKITATWNTGNVYDESSGADWSSDNTAVSTVSSTGLVSGVGAGTSHTSATLHNYPVGKGYICTGNQLTCPTTNYLASTTTVVASVPIPINFVAPRGATLADGSLRYSYSFQSSTGNLNDLSACQVGESVFYPGSAATYYFPLPMVGNAPNPTVRYGSATPGGFIDFQLPPTGYTKPYMNASFQATQRLQWQCANYNNGGFTNFIPDITITRSVAQTNSGNWLYSVTKSGDRNTANLP